MEWSEMSSKQAAVSIKAEGETCSGEGTGEGAMERV